MNNSFYSEALAFSRTLGQPSMPTAEGYPGASITNQTREELARVAERALGLVSSDRMAEPYDDTITRPLHPAVAELGELIVDNRHVINAVHQYHGLQAVVYSARRGMISDNPER